MASKHWHGCGMFWGVEMRFGSQHLHFPAHVWGRYPWFAKHDNFVNTTHLFSILDAFPVASNQSKWIRDVLVCGDAVWKSASPSPCSSVRWVQLIQANGTSTAVILTFTPFQEHSPAGETHCDECGSFLQMHLTSICWEKGAASWPCDVARVMHVVMVTGDWRGSALMKAARQMMRWRYRERTAAVRWFECSGEGRYWCCCVAAALRNGFCTLICVGSDWSIFLLRSRFLKRGRLAG